MSVGGAVESTKDFKFMIIILVSVTLAVLILLFVVYKMIQIRKRRLEADEWL